MPTSEVFQSVRFGNYTLVSQLGRGGMAEVFKARAGGVQGFEKIVCVKRILRQHTEDKHFVDMFVNEAKISARLSHPNIVQVYELGEVDGEFFMAMEFVHGRDLLRVLRASGTEGPPPAGVCAFIAREMCRALAAAHEHLGDNGQRQPIIHRDVSPQNVMISYDGIVKLVDFGIAKALEGAVMEETRTGALKGKFAYMAPEQLDGQKASPATDIFSVGVTLFEMLTGRRLFKGNTDYDTLVRVKTQPVPPPSELNPQVPPDLDKIVATALERDASRRYQRAALMARDLEVFCARVGFTSEDMKEYMRALFPNREEVPDGVVQMQTPISQSGVDASMSMSRSSSSARTPVTGTGSISGEKRPVLPTGGTMAATPSAKAASKGRGGMVAALLAVVVLGGGAFGVMHFLGGNKPAGGAKQPREPGEDDPGVIVARPKPEKNDALAGMEVVELQSTPSGAEVLEGPRLLGLTPIDLKLTDAKRIFTVKLSKSGFEDLTYTVSSNDVPSVTLKLQPKKHSSGGHAGPATPKPAGPDPSATPKVKTFDEVEQPKVKAIDE